MSSAAEGYTGWWDADGTEIDQAQVIGYVSQNPDERRSPVARYDLDSLRASGAGSLPIDPTQPGIFRYRCLLPFSSDDRVVSLGEGRTPLVRVQSSSAEILVKDESRNPTWSYKDRLAAVAVSRAVNDGAAAVIVSTTGNHGAAVAAYAARAGIRCVCLTLRSVPETMKVLMQTYGADVYAYEKPSDRWAVMAAAVHENGWIPMSSFTDPPLGSNPFGVEGYKTIAYEIFEDLGCVPDAVVVPTAYGDGVAGIHRGFTELVQLGLTASVPRMVTAEVLGAHSDALRRGTTLQHASPALWRETAALSIATTMATRQAHDALIESGGEAICISSESAIAHGQDRIAAREGLYLEASSVVGMLAVEEAESRGTISADDTVVVIGSSTGLKDVPYTAARRESVDVLPPTLEALTRRLESTMGARS